MLCFLPSHKITLFLRKPDLAILYVLRSCRLWRYCTGSHRPRQMLQEKYILG